MSDPQHTTRAYIEHAADQRVDITIAPIENDGRWFRVLNWLIDSGVWASLSDHARSMLTVLMRHRGADGLVRFDPRAVPSPIEYMGWQAGLSRSGAYRALTILREHPTGLLAVVAPQVWEPLPNRQWAGRSADPPDRGIQNPIHGTGNPTSGTGTEVALRGTRARQPEKELRLNTNTKEISHVEPGWAGADRDDLFGDTHDPATVLRKLGVREPLLTWTANLEDLTTEEIYRTAASVEMECRNYPRAVRNPVAVVCARLWEARGLDLPRGRRRRAIDQRADEVKREAIDTLTRLRERATAVPMSDDELRARREQIRREAAAMKENT